jgi:hypothetical protein
MGTSSRHANEEWSVVLGGGDWGCSWAAFIEPDRREAGGQVATGGCLVELQDAAVSVINMAPRERETVQMEPEEGADVTGGSKGGGDSNCQRWRQLRCQEVGTTPAGTTGP